MSKRNVLHFNHFPHIISSVYAMCRRSSPKRSLVVKGMDKSCEGGCSYSQSRLLLSSRTGNDWNIYTLSLVFQLKCPRSSTDANVQLGGKHYAVEEYFENEKHRNPKIEISQYLYIYLVCLSDRMNKSGIFFYRRQFEGRVFTCVYLFANWMVCFSMFQLIVRLIFSDPNLG